MENFNLKYSKNTYRFAAGIFFFLQGIVFASWASRIADVKIALSLSDATLGTILLGLPIGQFFTMPFSGYLVSRFSSKRIIGIASILYPATLMLLATATSAMHLFCCLIIFGVFANLNNISINTQAVDVEHIFGRSIMASFHGIWSFAGFTGGVLATIMANITIVEHFLIVNVFTFSMLIATYRFLMPTDISNAPENDQPDAQKPRTFLQPTPFIIFLGLIAFGSMSCEGTMFDWSVVYFRDVLETTPDLSRYGYIAFMSTMAGGRFIGDKLITKFGAIKVLQSSGIIIFIGMMLSVLIPNVLTSTIGFLMVGIGVSSVVPTCYSLAGRSRRMKTSIAIATVSTIGFLGFLLAPPLIGFISEVSSLRWSFTIMAAIGLLVTAVAPRLRTHVS